MPSNSASLEFGWSPSSVRTLDRDLGVSGAQMAGREDFKILVNDVAMGKVGAVFALNIGDRTRTAAVCTTLSRTVGTISADCTPQQQAFGMG